MPDLDTLKAIVCHDLDSDFVEALCVAVGWSYYSLYEELAADKGLTDDVREEEFARRRGFVVAKTLASVAMRLNIPVERRRLDTNGQHKTLIQAGRVIILQEAIQKLGERPKAADYKVQLADVNGVIRQLELDLGDRPFAVSDWSGCVLSVLLHGNAGPRFTSQHRALGGLFLAVPDSSYSQWVIRLDLRNIAMFGRAKTETDIAPQSASADQSDEVYVTRKKKTAGKKA